MNRLRVLKHIAFWLIWLMSMSVFYGINPKENLFLPFLANLSISLPVYIFYTYITVYKIIPHTLLKQRHLVFGLYIIIASFVISFIARILAKYIYHRYISDIDYLSIDLFNWIAVFRNMLWVNIPLFMFAAVKYVSNYSQELSRKNELEKQNLIAELSLLMIQLRPHFLFNTLNNLYSLAIAGDHATASGISKIINLLKYILIEYNQEKVEIWKEINLIEDYVELEKLRYDKRLEFRFEKDVDNMGLLIAPMILFTFVENSFKHGSSPALGKSYIHVRIKCRMGKLEFHAANTYPSGNIRNTGKGLGLDNVEKRLELLFPSKHRLSIDQNDQVFNVFLSMDLT